MPRHFLLNLLFFAVLTITGCANNSLTQDEQLDRITLEKTIELTSTSEGAIATAEIRYEAAVKANMYFYAPLSMQQADDTLALAREAEIKGLQSDSIIASSKVISLLDLAETNKENVNTLLLPLLQQKQVLEKLNSPRVLPAEFNNQLTDIKSLIRKIEDGADRIPISDVELTLVGLKKLELNTLLEIHWQPAKNTLTKAKNENADDNAPDSFALAKKLIDDAERDIRTQYSDRALVTKKGLAALRASQHALYVGRDAEQLLKLNHHNAEEAVLRFKSLLDQIGATLKAPDFRHMALKDQATALAQSAETQASRLIAPLEKRIAVLEKQLENRDKPNSVTKTSKLPSTIDQ
ncbi:MAG: hypothetical protein ACJAR6_000644 [Oleispira sp.]|jgi:hypothetical protein